MLAIRPTGVVYLNSRGNIKVLKKINQPTNKFGTQLFRQYKA